MCALHYLLGNSTGKVTSPSNNRPMHRGHNLASQNRTARL